jgi:voltage-gated potassium channel
MNLFKLTAQDDKEHISPFQLVILFLSFYVVIALAYELLWKPSLHVLKILDLFDFIICIIFQFDFFYRFAKSKNKLGFLKWGWIDFISSIPTVDFLRWGRFVRIFRILRLLRAFKSTKTIIFFIFKNRAKGYLASAALISFFLVIFSSIAILTFEQSPSAHIKTPVDAMWWSFSTISSTGSGDAYPVSTAGKILGITLAICGIGLFGTLTAFIAKHFISPSNEKEENEIAELRKDIKVLHTKLDLLLSQNNIASSSSNVGLSEKNQIMN